MNLEISKSLKLESQKEDLKSSSEDLKETIVNFSVVSTVSTEPCFEVQRRGLLRRFSEINLELDQSLKGLGITLILALLFLVFLYCVDWFKLYLYLSEG